MLLVGEGCTYRGQRTAFRDWFSPCTMWALRIQASLSRGSVTGAFTCRLISLTCTLSFLECHIWACCSFFSTLSDSRVLPLSGPFAVLALCSVLILPVSPLELLMLVMNGQQQHCWLSSARLLPGCINSSLLFTRWEQSAGQLWIHFTAPRCNHFLKVCPCGALRIKRLKAIQTHGTLFFSSRILLPDKIQSEGYCHLLEMFLRMKPCRVFFIFISICLLEEFMSQTLFLLYILFFSVFRIVATNNLPYKEGVHSLLCGSARVCSDLGLSGLRHQPVLASSELEL